MLEADQDEVEADCKQIGSILEAEIPEIGILFEKFTITSNLLNFYVFESIKGGFKSESAG